MGPVIQEIQTNAFLCIYRAKPKRQYKPRQLNLPSSQLKRSHVWFDIQEFSPEIEDVVLFPVLVLISL